MNDMKLKLLEDSDGLGMVLKEGKPIADVFYSLRIEQRYALRDEHEIPASKTITAQITVIDGERNLLDGSILTLQLGDGRQWHFSARRGDLVAATYQAANTNSDFPTPS
jgi:hypothetical protein